jgi:N-methylhydantoinase A/oxoprolinase/acetone carboxylase beta subunit
MRAGDRVLSFDMGGTTAKICLIDDFRPQTARAFEVARVGRFRKGSGLPLRIPVIEMVEIGAGGGSIAHVDTMAASRLDPRAPGADPGPACYGRGGTKPTVTDANLSLGRYDPARFAGGTMTTGPRGGARCAWWRRSERSWGLPPEMAALGVVEMVDENMANAARVHAIESGKTYEGRTLIAFGGGGPVHACRVAEKIGISRVLVPSGAGVGSAIGFLRAPVGYEVVRSLYQRLSTFEIDAVNALLTSMFDEATCGGRAWTIGRFDDPNPYRVHAVCRTGPRNTGVSSSPRIVCRRRVGNSCGIRTGIREVFRSARAGIGCGSDEFRCCPDDSDAARRNHPAGYRVHRAPVHPITTRSRHVVWSNSPLGCL